MRKFLFALLLLPLLVIAQEKKMITLEDVYRRGTFRVETVPGFSSMNDGRYYVETIADGIVKRSFETGEVQDTLIRLRHVKDERDSALSLGDISWSNDEKKILIFRNRESIYRHSSKAYVYAFDIASKKSIKIDDDKVLHATFSPDGSKVAFVKNNNLYYKDLKANKTTQVTRDGKWNHIINGNCDWVYEEEFSFTRAFQWSPKGNYLAYYKFDESKVPEYTFAIYDSLYPTQYTYKYPKAGEPNSRVEIHIYNLAARKDIKADIGKETDIYIPRIKWSNNDQKLAVMWMNRLQNNLKWLMADANTGKTTLLYNEKDEYYVEVTDDLTFLNDGKHFILSSEKDGFNHIYLNSINTSQDAIMKNEKQLTKGSFEVASIIGVDEKRNKIYFTAAYRSPLVRDFCSINLDGSGFKLMDERQGTHSVRMNDDFSFYLDVYSSLTTPSVSALYNINGKLIRTLRDNSRLKQTMNQYALSTPQFFQFTNSTGTLLNGWMLKPYNFDSTKKYPVLFCNYGGPGSQQVADRFGAVSFWHQLLQQNGIIVVSVDNRGTGYRGEQFKKQTYGQLGKLEIEDQIDAAKYLGKLDYVDAKRIGHWGWSYGGFMSALAITKGADVFSLAIMASPVTNWRYYDGIYTERYMGLPKDNPKGYDENSPINHTDKIKGKVLITHGTGDDNVHFQNAAMMVKAMIEKGIDFEMGYYPNQAHGFRGMSSYHVYRKFTDFVLKNL